MFHNIFMCCRCMLEKFLYWGNYRSSPHTTVLILVSRCAQSCRRRKCEEAKQKLTNSRADCKQFDEHFHGRLPRFSKSLVRGNSFGFFLRAHLWFFRFSKYFPSVCFSNAFSLTVRFLGTTINSRDSAFWREEDWIKLRKKFIPAALCAHRHEL